MQTLFIKISHTYRMHVNQIIITIYSLTLITVNAQTTAPTISPTISTISPTISPSITSTNSTVSPTISPNNITNSSHSIATQSPTLEPTLHTNVPTTTPTLHTNIATTTPTTTPTPPTTPTPTLSPTIHLNCTDEINCLSKGKCTMYGNCTCDWGYVTYEPEFKNTYCNYQQKEQFTAFLLSFFLGGFAGGRWYVDDTSSAIIKCLLVFIGCGIGCICAYILGKQQDEKTAFGCIPAFMASFALLIWCIVDIILFGLNVIPDSNGIELASWSLK
eukprot:480962_1